MIQIGSTLVYAGTLIKLFLLLLSVFCVGLVLGNFVLSNIPIKKRNAWYIILGILLVLSVIGYTLEDSVFPVRNTSTYTDELYKKTLNMEAAMFDEVVITPYIETLKTVTISNEKDIKEFVDLVKKEVRSKSTRTMYEDCSGNTGQIDFLYNESSKKKYGLLGIPIKWQSRDILIMARNKA